MHVIVRARGNIEVACLTSEQVTQLGVPLVPEWLDIYKDTREPGPHYVAWASFRNAIGAFEKALDFIHKARESGYASRDLSFEHGFALNAMSRFPEAIQVLDPAVEEYPDDARVIAELA